MSKPKQLHILHLVDAWFPESVREHGVFGGVQVRTREIVQRLKKDYRCKVDIFYPAHQNPLVHIFWSPILFFQLISHARKNPIDLIHVHGPKAALAVKLAQPFIQKPTILTLHADPFKASQFSITSKLEKFIYQLFSFSHIISVSKTFAERNKGVKNITVIRNGVNVSRFDKEQVEKNQHPTLIWVGKNDPTKGLSILKEAVNKIRKKHPDFKAELVTGGRLSGDELITAYKRAHMFVLPSLIESQPITLLEAWAAKLPVIVTKVGDNPKMVEHEKNGLLIEPNNVNQLYEAILKIIRARSLDEKMGENGYKKVKHHYSWDTVAEKTYELYQQVLRNSQKEAVDEGRKVGNQEIEVSTAV